MEIQVYIIDILKMPFGISNKYFNSFFSNKDKVFHDRVLFKQPVSKLSCLLSSKENWESTQIRKIGRKFTEPSEPWVQGGDRPLLPDFDQNSVSVSGIENKVQLWYRFRSQIFFFFFETKNVSFYKLQTKPRS